MRFKGSPASSSAALRGYSAVVGLPLLETDLLIKHHLEQFR